MQKRLFLIVLDSVGIGSAPDASDYDDAGAATLQHIAQAVGGLRLPILERLGLANILPLGADHGPITGLRPVERPLASWGAMRERSQGKDTITGHWEIAGLLLQPGFHVFPPATPAFPAELTSAFATATHRPFIGNCHGSGTDLINRFGEEAHTQGAFLIYTSADSVFQIAAHTDVIPLNELYAACEIARNLCDPYRVGRVIARPFKGEPGHYYRTPERIDYAYATAEPTILQHLQAQGIPVYSVGKIEDIFAHRGITQSWHTANNAASMEQMETLIRKIDHGFVFANFIDFDMLYGHRRDPVGYANCLEDFDRWLEHILPHLRPGDRLLLTADHGNDPIFKGSDHTRELVPLLVIDPEQPGHPLGLRDGFFDIAQSIADYFDAPPMARGRSFFSP
jgi:phosphopentomutase